MSTQRVKEIGWAYPTSPAAERFGHGKTGCWTVSVGNPDKPLRPIAGFTTHAMADFYAGMLPEPTSRYSVTKP